MHKLCIKENMCRPTYLSAPARILSLVDDERPTGPVWKASEAANTSVRDATFMILYVLTPQLRDVLLEILRHLGEKK